MLYIGSPSGYNTSHSHEAGTLSPSQSPGSSSAEKVRNVLKLTSGRGENQTTPAWLPSQCIFHPNTQPPKVTGTCPSAARYMHVRAESCLSLDPPVHSAGSALTVTYQVTAAGLVLFATYNSPLIKV